MTRINSFGVDFIYRLDKKDKLQVHLYARVTVNSRPAEISLKQKIPLVSWDSAREVVTGKGPKVKAINDHIEDVRFRITEHYRGLDKTGAILTGLDVKEAFYGVHKSQKGHHTLFELFKLHNEKWDEILEPGTTKNYDATEKYLKNYMVAQYRREDMFLAQLDYEFISGFETYILKNPLKAHDPCSANGAAKHIERIKKIITWGADKLKWMKEDPFKGYYPNRKKYKRPRLHLADFITLEQQPFVTETLQLTKDLFLFSCYTGMSYSDMMSLTENDFDFGRSGQVWCHKYREKTDVLASIPLLKEAVKLIVKYKDDPRAVSRGTVFPYITNAEYNRSLKIIGGICGIPFELQGHTGRHFFAKEVALKNGVPIETVRILMGHTKLSTTEIYAEVDEEKIEDDLRQLPAKFAKRKQFILKQYNEKLKLEYIPLAPVG